MYAILGFMAATSAAAASEKYDEAVRVSKLVGFYQKLTSSVIYYGWIIVPLMGTIVWIVLAGVNVTFNATYQVRFVTMLVGYSGVIIFDMLSRTHVGVTTFNVVYQLQVVFMFLIKYFLLSQDMSPVQWTGATIVTAAIMYIAWKSSSDHSQMRSGRLAVGITYVTLAALFRAVAILMDGTISNRMFSPVPVADFAPQWWLYECITFVGPACVVLAIQVSMWIVAQSKPSPLRLLKAEVKNRTYAKASTYSFGEYIFGVPTIAFFPYMGPVFQGLVPVAGIVIEFVLTRKPPHIRIIISILILLGGCWMLT